MTDQPRDAGVGAVWKALECGASCDHHYPRGWSIWYAGVRMVHCIYESEANTIIEAIAAHTERSWRPSAPPRSQVMDEQARVAAEEELAERMLWAWARQAHPNDPEAMAEFRDRRRAIDQDKLRACAAVAVNALARAVKERPLSCGHRDDEWIDLTARLAAADKEIAALNTQLSIIKKNVPYADLYYAELAHGTQVASERDTLKAAVEQERQTLVSVQRMCIRGYVGQEVHDFIEAALRAPGGTEQKAATPKAHPLHLEPYRCPPERGCAACPVATMLGQPITEAERDRISKGGP